MRPLLLLAFLGAVAACSDKSAADAADSLADDPERLKALRAECKADRAKVGDATCTAVAEATRRRFMGAGTPYTPASAAPTPRK